MDVLENDKGCPFDVRQGFRILFKSKGRWATKTDDFFQKVW